MAVICNDTTDQVWKWTL